MHSEERVQQRFVRETGWIEGDFDDFRMAGAVGTDFFIGWVFEIAGRNAKELARQQPTQYGSM